jgi:hypothetical protein
LLAIQGEPYGADNRICLVVASAQMPQSRRKNVAACAVCWAEAGSMGEQ